MAKTVRPNQVASVRHPDGGMVVPNPAEAYDTNDPIVRAHPWLFSTEEEIARRAGDNPESVAIETVTRAPGERRNTRRPRQS